MKELFWIKILNSDEHKQLEEEVTTRIGGLDKVKQGLERSPINNPKSAKNTSCKRTLVF